MSDYWVTVISAIFAVPTLCIAFAWIHHFASSVPWTRRRRLNTCVIRILLMVPVYSATSFFGLQFPHSALIFRTVRECYEAFALYSFFLMITLVLGGEQRIARRLSTRPPVPHLFPLCHLAPFAPGYPFLWHSKVATLQFVVLRPLIAIIAAVCGAFGVLGDGVFSPYVAYPYLAFAASLSQAYALYCLALFYSRVAAPLKPIRPIPKFMAVKLILFFTYWQGVVLAVLVDSGHIAPRASLSALNVASQAQEMLTVIEMFFFALYNLAAFRPQDFDALTPQHQHQHGGVAVAGAAAHKAALQGPAALPQLQYAHAHSHTEGHAHAQGWTPRKPAPRKSLGGEYAHDSGLHSKCSQCDTAAVADAAALMLLTGDSKGRSSSIVRSSGGGGSRGRDRDVAAERRAAAARSEAAELWPGHSASCAADADADADADGQLCAAHTGAAALGRGRSGSSASAHGLTYKGDRSSLGHGHGHDALARGRSTSAAPDATVTHGASSQSEYRVTVHTQGPAPPTPPTHLRSALATRSTTVDGRDAYLLPLPLPRSPSAAPGQCTCHHGKHGRTLGHGHGHSPQTGSGAASARLRGSATAPASPAVSARSLCAAAAAAAASGAGADEGDDDGVRSRSGSLSSRASSRASVYSVNSAAVASIATSATPSVAATAASAAAGSRRGGMKPIWYTGAGKHDHDDEDDDGDDGDGDGDDDEEEEEEDDEDLGLAADDDDDDDDIDIACESGVKVTRKGVGKDGAPLFAQDDDEDDCDCEDGLTSPLSPAYVTGSALASAAASPVKFVSGSGVGARHSNARTHAHSHAQTSSQARLVRAGSGDAADAANVTGAAVYDEERGDCIAHSELGGDETGAEFARASDYGDWDGYSDAGGGDNPAAPGDDVDVSSRGHGHGQGSGDGDGAGDADEGLLASMVDGLTHVRSRTLAALHLLRPAHVAASLQALAGTARARVGGYKPLRAGGATNKQQPQQLQLQQLQPLHQHQQLRHQMSQHAGEAQLSFAHHPSFPQLGPLAPAPDVSAVPAPASASAASAAAAVAAGPVAVAAAPSSWQQGLAFLPLRAPSAPPHVAAPSRAAASFVVGVTVSAQSAAGLRSAAAAVTRPGAEADTDAAATEAATAIAAAAATAAMLAAEAEADAETEVETEATRSATGTATDKKAQANTKAKSAAAQAAAEAEAVAEAEAESAGRALLLRAHATLHRTPGRGNTLAHTASAQQRAAVQSASGRKHVDSDEDDDGSASDVVDLADGGDGDSDSRDASGSVSELELGLATDSDSDSDSGPGAAAAVRSPTAAANGPKLALTRSRSHSPEHSLPPSHSPHIADGPVPVGMEQQSVQPRLGLALTRSQSQSHLPGNAADVAAAARSPVPLQAQTQTQSQMQMQMQTRPRVLSAHPALTARPSLASQSLSPSPSSPQLKSLTQVQTQIPTRPHSQLHSPS